MVSKLSITVRILTLIFILGVAQLSFARPNIDTLSKSVVRIICPLNSGGAKTGTGFVVTSDGYILTNNHVVDGTLQCRVLFPNQRSGPIATLVATEANKDISIIKISRTGLETVGLAAQMPGIGDEVWALGFPGNADIVGTALTPTVTNGLFQRAFRGRMGRTIADVVQHSAEVNPGNSGGPTFDQCGNVIGINTFIPSASVSDGSVASATGIYFGTNISESIAMLRSKNINVNIVRGLCVNTDNSGADTSDLEADLSETRAQLEANLSETRAQLEAAKAQAEAIKQNALAAGRTAEEARAEAANTLRLVDLLQASADDAEKRMKKLQTGILISAPIILLMILGVLILALRKPRQLVVNAARNVSDSVSRRISPIKAASTNSGVLQLVLDYEEDGRSLQKTIALKARDKEGYVVGRNAALSHLVFQDASISKRHFRLSFKDEKSFWLEDLNSFNGSEYGGQQLTPFEKVALKTGTSFIAGGIRIKTTRG